MGQDGLGQGLCRCYLENLELEFYTEKKPSSEKPIPIAHLSETAKFPQNRLKLKIN